jgi:hypothetical protein
MGYCVRKLKGKVQLPHRKIQYITYKKNDSSESTAKNLGKNGISEKIDGKLSGSKIQ